MEPQELRAWRQQREMTQTDLAIAIKMSERAVQMWESGQRPIPEHLSITLAGVDATGILVRATAQIVPEHPPILAFDLVWRGYATHFIVDWHAIIVLAGKPIARDQDAVVQVFNANAARIKTVALDWLKEAPLPMRDTAYLGASDFEPTLAPEDPLEEALDALRATISFIDPTVVLGRRAQNQAMQVLDKYRPDWRFR